MAWWNNCPTPGWYCGNSVIANPNNNDPYKILYCNGVGAEPLMIGPCTDGKCIINPPGVPDKCPNANNPVYTGNFMLEQVATCGYNINAYGTISNHLYILISGNLNDLGPCSNECITQPYGEDDYCYY